MRALYNRLLLINTGSHVVLIDTGAGELFGAGSGLLISNLKAAGYEPQQIDTILLTSMPTTQAVFPLVESGSSPMRSSTSISATSNTL